MEEKHFDRVTRSLADPSRRGLLRGLAAIAGLLAARAPGTTNARKRKGKKNGTKKLRRNAFGCVNVGNACRGNDENCCSGICEGQKPKRGKKDKSRCVAHNVGICQPGQDDCQGVQVACGENAFCLRTTGNASFCAGLGKCFPCTKDTDCEFIFGPGAACSVCAECGETNGTICNSAGA